MPTRPDPRTRVPTTAVDAPRPGRPEPPRRPDASTGEASHRWRRRAPLPPTVDALSMWDVALVASSPETHREAAAGSRTRRPPADAA